MSTRRRFVGSITAIVVTTPLRARAQRTNKLPTVALVFNSVPAADMAGPDPVDGYARAFVHGLRDLGYVEGRNIVIERRSAQGRPERMPALMQELVRLPVDVIVVTGRGARAAQLATDTVPIVALVSDPDSIGLVASLARPGRNITGQAGNAGPAIHGKLLQLLKEAAPKSSRIALIDWKNLDGTASPGVQLRRRETEAAARAMGQTIVPVGVDRPEEFEQAFAVIAGDGADALLVAGTAVNYAHRHRIVDFAAQRRLPSISDGREWPEAGGLIGYGSNFNDQMRRAVGYVDKILKGTRPADLPFEQPTKFELVINLKTARALGLTIPQSLLLRADEVIE